MFKFNAKYFCKNVEKTFKVTFSGLDKFLTNADIEKSMERINELKILRLNKSPNRNYCHLELSSLLNDLELKEKLENIKILGKSVKVRVKEFDEETDISLKQNHTIFDQALINDIQTSRKILKENSGNFYIKHLTSNLVNVKALTDSIDNIDINIVNIKPTIYEFEYKINLNNDSLKLDKQYITIKDSKDLKNDKENEKLLESNNLILDRLYNIFTKLQYSSYDHVKKKGVLKEIQIRVCNMNYLVAIMLSQAELTSKDFTVIREAVSYEFRSDFNISIYLAINEKVQASFDNAQYYQHVYGKPAYLKVDSMNIYPFDNDFLFYLKDLDLAQITKSNKIAAIIDKSSNFVPYSCLFGGDRKFYFNPEKYNFDLFDMENKKIELAKNKLLSINDSNFKADIYNQESFEFIGQDSLCLSNMKRYPIRANFIRRIKYHLLLSNSFSQILDCLRNFPSNAVKYKSITFIKKGTYEIDDIILALEII
jgi:hypothetical protein